MTTTGYERALRRLLEVPSSPRLGLGRMEALLRRLDDPQRAFRALHVAGTNAKGSICAMLDAVLGEGGVRRGMTTSPHLLTATERIQLGGAPIARERFVALEERVYRAAHPLEDAPTFFERVIAMAFLAFAEEGVEVGVVEVGLGGRLDATNVLSPVAVAIAPIGIDHTQFLGDTLAAIAGEKAGILKAGVPATSSPQQPGALDVIRARAAALEVPLEVVGEQILLGAQEDGYLVKRRSTPLAAPFSLALAGHHQAENAAVALGVLDAAGLVPDLEVRARGLAAARWPGRFERVRAEGYDDVTVILDGAHNPQAAATLAYTLSTEEVTRGRPWVALVGMTRGHEAANFGAAVAHPPLRTFTTQARAPRSVSADDVAHGLRAVGWRRVKALPLVEALGTALEAARKEGAALVVTGSLYLVGEVRGRLLQLEADPVLPLF